MSPRISDGLDPAPFREWADQRLEVIARVELGDGVARLARDLGIDERRLHRWRFEVESIDRLALADALHSADSALWEVYGVEEDAGELEDELRERRRRSDAKLTIEQIRLLHRMHDERGVSVRELGRNVWAQRGYASPEAASRSIARSFHRLHLPVTPDLESRARTLAAGYRRCREVKVDGAACGHFSMRGEEWCWSHHPDNRDAVLALALGNSPLVKQMSA